MKFNDVTVGIYAAMTQAQRDEWKREWWRRVTEGPTVHGEELFQIEFRQDDQENADQHIGRTR